MIPTRITNHEEQAADLLTDKWKNSPNIKGMLQALVVGKNTLEASVWDTLVGRILENAAGVWLDALGVIVGEPRNGRVDDAYRFAIGVRVRVNRSQGRTSDVIDVALLLDNAATYYEYFPLAWEVEIYDTPFGGDFATLLKQAKAASSYGVLLTSAWPVAEVSQFVDSSDMSPTDVFESAL